MVCEFSPSRNPFSAQWATNMLNLRRPVGAVLFTVCFSALLWAFGCSKPESAALPSTETTDAGDSVTVRARDADRSQVSQEKQDVDAPHPKITHEGNASHPLELTGPGDGKQEASKAELTITWYGDPPEEACVYVGSHYVGGGREGFAAAVKAVSALPKRGKLTMSHFQDLGPLGLARR